LRACLSGHASHPLALLHHVRSHTNICDRQVRLELRNPVAAVGIEVPTLRKRSQQAPLQLPECCGAVRGTIDTKRTTHAHNSLFEQVRKTMAT
jgi:hypothetical protein